MEYMEQVEVDHQLKKAANKKVKDIKAGRCRLTPG